MVTTSTGVPVLGVVRPLPQDVNYPGLQLSAPEANSEDPGKGMH